jgi:hypothetical protein
MLSLAIPHVPYHVVLKVTTLVDCPLDLPIPESSCICHPFLKLLRVFAYFNRPAGNVWKCKLGFLHQAPGWGRQAAGPGSGPGTGFMEHDAASGEYCLIDTPGEPVLLTELQYRLVSMCTYRGLGRLGL